MALPLLPNFRRGISREPEMSTPSTFTNPPIAASEPLMSTPDIYTNPAAGITPAPPMIPQGPLSGFKMPMATSSEPSISLPQNRVAPPTPMRPNAPPMINRPSPIINTPGMGGRMPGRRPMSPRPTSARPGRGFTGFPRF